MKELNLVESMVGTGKPYILKITKVKTSSRNVRLTKPEDAAEFLQPIYKALDDDQEHFVLIFLTAGKKGIVTGYKVLFSGGQENIIVDPKVIFRNALLFGATAIVLSHNHPSGDLEPNEADISITKRCIEAGMLLGIQVVDHIIISPSGEWISLKQERKELFFSLPMMTIGW